ncbi:MAG: hypothetical protein QXO41_09655, partial [Thermofilum sp.]
ERPVPPKTNTGLPSKYAVTISIIVPASPPTATSTSAVLTSATLLPLKPMPVLTTMAPSGKLSSSRSSGGKIRTPRPLPQSLVDNNPHEAPVATDSNYEACSTPLGQQAYKPPSLIRKAGRGSVPSAAIPTTFTCSPLC